MANSRNTTVSERRPSRLLGRQPAATTRVEAKETQRRRLLLAMAHLVGKQGYADTSIATVIERAGVSRKTFYEYFTDKEACFLAAYDELTGLLIDALARLEVARGGSRATAQLERYLEALSLDPVVARAFVVEVLGAGPGALKARERVNRRFADLVFGHVSKDPLVRKAIIGGVNDVVSGELLEGRTDFLPLLERLARFVER